MSGWSATRWLPIQQPAQSFSQNQVFGAGPHLARRHSMPSMLMTFGMRFMRSKAQNDAVL